MNTLKKFITRTSSLMLAAIVAASMVAGASAKSYNDVPTENAYHEQIDLLSDIGVIVGTSENEFSPENDVTREQMALLLFRLMLAKQSAGGTNSTAFTDLYDDTYSGAISWANAAGYIIGTSDTTFEPVGGITLRDAMTMAVRALGQSNPNMDKGYPWTYIDAAVKLGLDRGLEDVAYTATLTRAQTAAILYNAFTAEYLVGKTASNGATIIERTTIAEYVFGYEIDEAVVMATNDFAAGKHGNVIKDGYVTLELENGKSMTVKFEQTGLDGSANEWLGKKLTVIYKIDDKTKLANVLGASYTGSHKSADSVTLSSDSKNVTIGGVKYNVVEKLSDSISTNQNELIVFAYTNDGILAQIKTNAALAASVGIGDITLIDDNGDGIAERALVKNLTAGRLSISSDGKINIAENLTAEKLTGGFVNTVKAENGDYVLYYYNKGNASLEIAQKLELTESALVTRLTDTSVSAGDKTYVLGSAASGVTADSLRASIAVGTKAVFAVKGDIVLAVYNPANTASTSTFLVATTNAVPVYTEGALRYIVTANVGGKTVDIVTSSYNVTAGGVYRYTVDGNGIYTLAAEDSASFTQSGEFASSATANGAFTLSRGTGAFYTFNGTKFVTDANTVIVVKNGSEFLYKTGVYTSEISVSDGAKVTAVYENSVGDVETLRFLYVSNGSLTGSESTAANAKILSFTGTQLDNGKVYRIYETFNFATGKRATALSLSTLDIGSVCAIDSNGFITNITVSSVTGVVTGFTSSTVTVGGNVYRLSSGFSASTIGSDLSAASVKLSDTVNRSVQFTVIGGEVKSMIVGEVLSFSAAFNKDTNVITFTPNVSGIHGDSVSLVKVTRDGTELPASDWNMTLNENGTMTTSVYWIQGGSYSFTFTLGGVSYTTVITLPDVTPAE
ncbi:MAG: S-layer homology domain-containing protein [Eubacteriales bacterium]